MARMMEAARPCPRCEGSGQCRDCGGTGKARCPVCEGKGEKISPRGAITPCKTCAGTGHIGCPSQCPSCNGTGKITESFQKEIQQKYTVSFANYTPSNKAVGVLAALSVLIYVLAPPDFPSVLGQIDAWRIQNALVNRPNVMESKELWRFVTPVFLHGGWWHLLANMSFLLAYGPALEGLYGPRRFLALYFLSAVAGNVLSWLFNPVPGIGASTAMFGLGAAYVGLSWRWGIIDEANARRIGLALVLFLVVGFALGSALPIRLDNWGHLGGGLAGLAFAYLGPRPQGH